MEMKVINEGTAEFELSDACPTCEGTLELRVSSGDGAWTFCNTCHVIGHPKVFRDPKNGYSLQFENVGYA